MEQIDEFRILLKSAHNRAKHNKGKITFSQQELSALEAICYYSNIHLRGANEIGDKVLCDKCEGLGYIDKEQKTWTPEERK